MTQSLLESDTSRNVALVPARGSARVKIAGHSLQAMFMKNATVFVKALPVRQRAYTLVDVLLAVAIIAVLAAIAIPAYTKYVDKARVAVAVTDIAGMSLVIVKYMDDNPSPPDSLSQVGLQGRIDPWGRPYVYTNLQGAMGKGNARKDKNLNPLNTDFDLYSVGKDGDSKLPLTTKVSQDDVIRARDGRFVGLASDFDP